MTYYVYILQCNDNSLYTGITTDLQRRVFEHNNSDKGAKYTRPVRLVYNEKYEDRSSASKRECAIKKLSRTGKLSIIRDGELDAI